MTSGYPYFLQELGYAVWTLAAGPTISLEDVHDAIPDYEAKLDESFFRVRLDRTTELQRAYLRAMAQLGPQPHKAADVAELMGRTSQNRITSYNVCYTKLLRCSPSSSSNAPGTSTVTTSPSSGTRSSTAMT